MPSPHSTPLRPRGLWIPLVTPFAGPDVDHPALARLTAHMAECGVDGLVICGTTGEAAALSADEQLEVLRTVHAHAQGLPLMMGLAEKGLSQALARVDQFASAGTSVLSGLLVAAPSYVRPSQAGLIQWFETIASHSPWPVTVYDIPYRTGAVLTRETLLQLAAHPQIVALKDCGGDLGKTLALIHDGRLSVMCGEDLNLLGHATQGASGAITASAHLATAAFAQVLHGAVSDQAAEAAAARTIWRELVPLIEACFSEPNPGPIKAALATQGLIRADTRAPMVASSVELGRRVAAQAACALALSRQ